MGAFTESVVEQAALGWLEALGYQILHGPEIAAGEALAERADPSFRDVILERRLREVLARLNPALPAEALEDAYRRLTRIDAPSLLEHNHAVQRMLVNGVTVEYRRSDGSIAGAQAQILDFEQPALNEWLAVNQFTVAEAQHARRPDIVVFVNGLLTEDELAFYDALEVNDSAVKVLGDETLRTIARELVATVRRNVSIDWTVRENVRAALRVMVKRILRKYGYPPDKQEKAT